jgi:hypothetical protein
VLVGSKGEEEQMSKQRDVEQHSRSPAGDDALERRSVIVALAAAGIAGPLIFAADQRAGGGA